MQPLNPTLSDIELQSRPKSSPPILFIPQTIRTVRVKPAAAETLVKDLHLQFATHTLH